MKQEELEKEIMSEAVLDNFGLYEVIWELNTKAPNLQTSEKLALAQTAISNLLAKKWIALYRTRWPDDSDPIIISNSDIEKILSDPDSWRQPTDEHPYYITYLATDEGDKVYYAQKS